MTDIKITITFEDASRIMIFTDNLLPLPDYLQKVPRIEALAWKLDGLKIRAMREMRALPWLDLQNAQEATQEGPNGAEEAPTQPQGGE